MFNSAKSALTLAEDENKSINFLDKYLDRVINNMLTFNQEDSKLVLSELNIL